LDYYDEYLYCVATSVDSLIKVNPQDSEDVTYYPFPRRVNSIRNIAVNPVNGHFFISSISNSIYEVEIVNDTLLETVNSFATEDPRTGERIRHYGLSWFRDDPDGYNLYLISDGEPVEDADSPDVSVFKMNVNTGEFMFLTGLDYLDAGTKGRGGIFITPRWNNMIWVMAAVFDNSGDDWIGVYELGPNASWIRYDPQTDTLLAGESIKVSLILNTTDLDADNNYSTNIEFTHNAMVRIDTVLISLRVSWNDLLEDTELPLEFGLEQNYPNPFNPTTRIAYTIEEQSTVKLTIHDITGREIATLIDEKQPAGHHFVPFDATHLPNGLYLYRLENKGKLATKKMIVIK